MKKLILICFLASALGSGAGLYLGYRAGYAEAFHHFVGSDSHEARRSYATRYAFGLEQFQGITGQDLWVLNSVHPGVENGFFVDLGSADGFEISNTWLLEQQGWSGICIDPFPRNMASRSCQVFEEAVDDKGGRTVKFQNPGSYSGGILDYAGWWVSDSDKKSAVEVNTATLADILRRAQAPKFIHYMNVDIEGAEYEALRSFPFDEYAIGAMTIEHNDVEERRDSIRALLRENGYRLKWAIRDQDWYVPFDRDTSAAWRTGE